MFLVYIDRPCTLKFICERSTLGRNRLSERKLHQNYEWTKHLLVEMFAPISRKWPQQCLTQGLDVYKRALIDSTEIISVKLKLLAAPQFSRWALLSTLAKSLLSIFLR